MNHQIISHPDYQATYRRWLSVCLAAGRSKVEAEQRARGYAHAFCARQIERQRFYAGRKPIGPDANQEATAPAPRAGDEFLPGFARRRSIHPACGVPIPCADTLPDTIPTPSTPQNLT